MTSTARGRLYVLAAAALWSLSGAITKSIDLDGLTIAFYRGLFAGLVLVPFVPRPRRVVPAGDGPARPGLRRDDGAVPGRDEGDDGRERDLPAILGHVLGRPARRLFLGERPDRRALAGIGLAMAGVGVIVGFGHGGAARVERRRRSALASGVAYAGVVIGMRGLRGLDPVWLSAVNNLARRRRARGLDDADPGAARDPDAAAEASALVAFGVVQMAIPYALFARGLREVERPGGGPARAGRADPEPGLGLPRHPRDAGRRDARRRGAAARRGSRSATCRTRRSADERG